MRDLAFPVAGQLSEWELEHRARRLRKRMEAAGVSRDRAHVRPGAGLTAARLRGDDAEPCRWRSGVDACDPNPVAAD